MRLRGIALSCQNAGMPVEEDEVRDWISGCSLPPRHLVGLEDSVRVPTAADFYLRAMMVATSRKKDDSDALFRKLFDARSQAMKWADDEVEYYENLFHDLSGAVRNFRQQTSIRSVAEGVSDLLRLARVSNERDNSEPGDLGASETHRPALVWLVSVFTPVLLQRSGLTENLLPQMVPNLRFLDMSANQIEQALIAMLETEVRKGNSSLAAMERSLTSVRDNLLTNRPSKTWEAAVITMVFPNIKRGRLASAINVRPQGAGYIKARILSGQSSKFN